MSTTSTAPRTKSTRSSIRQSLNFASVGKAFAETFNKEKEPKPSKDSRRLSAVAPRQSLDARPSPPPSKRSRTPETKTITARRRSSLATASQRGTSLDNPALRANTPPSAVVRPAALKPRPGASSNLPKYRPKSIILDGQKRPPASPTGSRTSSRKRTSISEDESDELVMIDKKDSENLQPPSADRSTRPISPLPQRAAFKVNLTNIAPSTATSPATPTKATKHKRETSTPTSTAKSSSSNRLTKAVKAASTIPRPSSSSSVAGPSTPKGSPSKDSSKKTIFRSAKSGATDSSTESSSRSHSASTIPSIHESPLVRHVRNRSKNETPTQQGIKMAKTSSTRSPRNPTSDEEDEEDVEMLLAPTTNLAAPTPAMPRITTSRTRQRLAPQTPTKPVAPSASLNKDGSPASLRPNPSPNSNSETRGSILSWDQLAHEGSRTVPIDELGKMLSEIPSPFTAPLSPMPTGSMLLDPPSPTLSTLDSPAGYGGSISQVLLPNVTPSPAVPRIGKGYHRGSEGPPSAEGNSGTVTLLRLQLSSAESMAKDRLKQLQSLEEELHNVKQARVQDVDDLSHQIAILEQRMKGSLEVRERTNEERDKYTRELEMQLERAREIQEQAVTEAVERAMVEARSAIEQKVQKQKKSWELESLAGSAKREWMGVKDECEGELDRLNGEREMLKVLLAELDLAQQQVISGGGM
ncbi:hypothetical protein K435DRAFT_759010 [Dendrothele bispora CBS 962.96]|uniref:Uncharacterized protein n=1 Tax=Dendrothele bispora (strain CBS 962.96) TaxID=1314807 RepID=A0A4S8LQI4_DENBC|nr:hypothetical protein K435DRAFT_759010 [Dendrothele bispora CBS 962.96]